MRSVSFVVFVGTGIEVIMFIFKSPYFDFKPFSTLHCNHTNKRAKHGLNLILVRNRAIEEGL